jgi:TolB-like protein/Flp pilus assembly protein TadD
MNGFFEELQRRKVYRVAAAYIVAAGFIIQIASAAFPAWELPNWTLRLVIALLLIGFPIALILAWAFDVTPQGIKVTPPTAVTEPNRTLRGRRNLLVLLIVGLLVSGIAGFFLLPRASARKLDKSIAVLPFENRSDDKANAYFADGIQDDVLTNLSKIGDLRVISRTSVMSYRGKTLNLRDIGKALGVSTILEGSVQRIGNRVRVNVQLIDATTDEHIWANDYDRDLTDVFAIQTDLAHEIANALQAKLSPAEKAQMERKPTQNSEAYLLFVQAHDLYTRSDKFREDSVKAAELYEKATQLDPNFALAYAMQSIVESWIYHSYDPSSGRRDKARALTDKALRLQPDLPEAHLALGYCYYYGDADYERALAEFAIAQRGLPNTADVYVSIAAIERRQGKWEQSTKNFEKAVSLNPKDAFLLQNLAINYEATKNYEVAAKTVDRGIELDPRSFSLRAIRAKLAIDWKGDLSVTERELEHVPKGVDPEGLVTLARVNFAIFQRKFSDALTILQQTNRETFHGESALPMPKSAVEGSIYFYMKDQAKARLALERARVVLEQSVRDAPDNAARHAEFGAILAALGRKEEAIREGKRAVELLPESKDALEGPMMTLALAQIYAWTGEHEEALRLLEHSLSNPDGITVPALKIDPAWDLIRQDSRFQALLEKYSAKI